MYYSNKLDILVDIFGSKNIKVELECLTVNDKNYPIIDDVIILLDPAQYPESLSKSIKVDKSNIPTVDMEFAEDIQFTFGAEWQEFSEIMLEHEEEFLQYFDLINLSDLKNKRICDLGCGIGRWDYFLKDQCKELILVDFSEAVFVARHNLKDAENILYFMGDLKKLPFRKGFVDYLFCIGVLHHLPNSALEEVRLLKKYASQILIYLYYALDNRPFYFRVLIKFVTKLRMWTASVRNSHFRNLFSWAGALFIYYPFIILGSILRPLGRSHFIPLYEYYHCKTLKRIRQDVYDRFFTRIEQRFTKKEIMALKDTFSNVIISNQLPYWHFLVKR
jgi:ubiquinone/menaquinone biosynthesis C-methylase UbiE